jgi:hypothetical protein
VKLDQDLNQNEKPDPDPDPYVKLECEALEAQSGTVEEGVCSQGRRGGSK